MFEVDFELVAFDDRDGPVAELAVEHALAEGEVGACLVAEADCGCAGFDDAPRLGIVAPFAAGALEAWAPGRGAHRLRRAEVGEWVRAFRPLCAPQAFAARHRGFFSDVRLGQLAEETARNAAGPLAVDAAVGGVEDGRASAGA